MLIMNKIKVTFVYKKNNYFLSKHHRSKLYYHFFIKALKRNKEIDVTYIKVDKTFNCNHLTECDIFLSYSAKLKFSPYYQNMRKCKIPSLFLSGDQHDYPAQKSLTEEYGITNFFFMTGEKYFYKFFPKHCNYRQVFLGAEPEIYFNGMENWKKRKSNKVLNSGLTCDNRFYNLRLMARSCPNVEYYDEKLTRESARGVPEHLQSTKYIGDKYVNLLYQYRAAIVACTTGIVPKYFEIPACGCLPFMEVTPQNEVSTMGYTDGVNAVFINKNNFSNKLEEYMETRDDPKWHNIAKASYNYALNNFTNDHGVSQLVQFMKEII